jgi:prepilin-type N-terminal cleavage/methylation domain-containing protein
MANPIPGSAFINSGYKRRTSGFTFIEVIVAISVALVVVLAVYFSLYQGTRSMSHTRVAILKKQELMKTFYRMRHQLLNLYDKEEGESLLGESGLQERHSELYFLTTTPDKSRGVGEVGYKIMKDEDGISYLAYTEFPYPRIENRFALNNRQDKWEEFSRLVKEFQVEYETNNLWHKEWKQNELPDKIKITLYYVEDEESDKMTEFSFIVVPGKKSLF